MHISKYLLLAGFTLLMALPAVAQESSPAAAPTSTVTPTSSLQWSNRDMTYRGKNYDVMDSAYYPKGKPSKQFKKYMDHQEVFPPRPRNMIELGFGLGLCNIIGNVPTLMLWQGGGGGFDLHVRKSFGYTFSARAQFVYGVGRNLDLQPTASYDGPYTKFGYEPITYASSTGNQPNPIYRYTRTEQMQLNLDLMVNALNINFHQARNGIAVFAYFGIGGLAYKTRINALDGKYAPYDFGTIVKDPNEKKGKVRKDLKKGMDKTFENAADNNSSNHILDHKNLDFSPSVGLGVQYKINKKFNVQIEERYSFPDDRYIDGSPFGKPLGQTVAIGKSAEAVNYFSIGINYNFNPNGKKKSVEPLYWINPLDHAYSELSYPRHMILPNPVLPDEDGDGITDQFDKCPKTPKGVAVDAHGCPLDTDGDGVPDYKDKQLITPTECQPVDADGVGKCPCPDDCKVEHDTTRKCGNIGSGTLLFTSGTRINTGMEAQLAVLTSQMRASPNCKVVVSGAGQGSKPKVQHSWEHANAIIEFMTEKNNISRDRFILKYGEEGDENIVTYRAADRDEQGSSNPPPPHPEIK